MEFYDDELIHDEIAGEDFLEDELPDWKEGNYSHPEIINVTKCACFYGGICNRLPNNAHIQRFEPSVQGPASREVKYSGRIKMERIKIADDLPSCACNFGASCDMQPGLSHKKQPDQPAHQPQVVQPEPLTLPGQPSQPDHSGAERSEFFQQLRASRLIVVRTYSND